MKKFKRLMAATLVASFTPLFANAVDISSSQNNQLGHRLKLTTDVHGFSPTSTHPQVDQSKRCAGRGSTYSVVKAGTEATVVKFYQVEKPVSKDTCPGNDTLLVAKGSLYSLPIEAYEDVQSKTTGIAYGALVVPFKFRLGQDKKLVSSSTIAPFIGIRWTPFQGMGYELMPVFAAGLGLVPIADSVTKTTETKSAFSTSVGITLTRVNDSKFSAGLLYGRDFLSKADRAIDPSVNKPWISIWLGVNI